MKPLEAARIITDNERGLAMQTPDYDVAKALVRAVDLLDQALMHGVFMHGHLQAKMNIEELLKEIGADE